MKTLTLALLILGCMYAVSATMDCDSLPFDKLDQDDSKLKAYLSQLSKGDQDTLKECLGLMELGAIDDDADDNDDDDDNGDGEDDVIKATKLSLNDGDNDGDDTTGTVSKRGFRSFLKKVGRRIGKIVKKGKKYVPYVVGALKLIGKREEEEEKEVSSVEKRGLWKKLKKLYNRGKKRFDQVRKVYNKVRPVVDLIKNLRGKRGMSEEVKDDGTNDNALIKHLLERMEIKRK